MSATDWTRRKFLRSTAAGVAWATGGGSAAASLFSTSAGARVEPEIGSLSELIASADVDRLDRVGQPKFLEQNDSFLTVSGRPKIQVDHAVFLSSIVMER